MNFLKKLVLAVKIMIASIRANFFREPDPDCTLIIGDPSRLEVVLYDNGHVNILEKVVCLQQPAYSSTVRASTL